MRHLKRKEYSEVYRNGLGLLAQSVERCTGIAEVMGSNPYRPEFFWPKQVHGIFHVHLLLIRVDKTVSNIPNQNSYMEICPTLVTRRKKSLFISLPNSKLTISLIYIYKYYAIDIADPSSMQDACHMNFVIDLTYRGVSVA